MIATVTVVALNADTLAAGRVLWAVKQLDLPLGWELSTGNGPTEIPNDLLAILTKLLGLALTIGAVMLGAPFWFDLLSKIMRVRSTGAPPPASDAVRRGEGEQPHAGVTVN